MFSDNYVNLCAKAGKSASAVAKDIGFSGAAGNKWANGSMPHKPTLVRIADYFGITVSELVGDEFRSPHITDDYVTFPVLGKVAAGYNKLELQDWQDFDGDTVDIPQTWLKGRDYKDYFVVRVNGDSMYPQYMDGDIVVVMRQSVIDYSGQICVVRYEDECGTLKRVEYIPGEWMKLSPINQSYPPITIKGEYLNHCEIQGVPKYLIREVK